MNKISKLYVLDMVGIKQYFPPYIDLSIIETVGSSVLLTFWWFCKMVRYEYMLKAKYHFLTFWYKRSSKLLPFKFFHSSTGSSTKSNLYLFEISWFLSSFSTVVLPHPVIPSMIILKKSNHKIKYLIKFWLKFTLKFFLVSIILW